jgi:DNA-binding CsgD family transcriptional regulator
MVLPVGMPPRAATLPLLFVSGNWDDVRDLADYTRSHGSPLERQMAATILGQLHHHQGDLDAAWEMVREILPRGEASQPEDALFPYAMETLRTATWLSLNADDTERATRWLATHDAWLNWSSAIRGKAESATLHSQILHAAGQIDQAAESARRAVELASEPRQPLALVEAQLALGRIALAQGETADAEQILCCAYDLARDCEIPHEIAMCELALVDLAQYQTRTPIDATELLDLAEQRAVSLRAVPILAMIEQRRSTLRPHSGHTSLTDRELEVLRMVAQGLTDAEAAERLFISPRTVSQHMRSVYNKLDVSSRSAATRWAVQHDLL